MHRFAAICEFKLELQPGNAHLGKNRQCCAACDLNIWRMTSKITRALLLCHFKICALFCSVAICGFKLELQYSNAQFGSQLSMFWPVWPWNLTDALKDKGNLCHRQLCASFRSHLGIQTGVTVQKHPNWVQICFYVRLWPLTSNLDLLLWHHACIENNSWNFHDDKMTRTLWKGRDRQTDRQIDRQTGGLR